MKFAYRALHSTETIMTRAVNNLLTAADNKAPSMLLSPDISAAFDTLDHRRLFKSSREHFRLDVVVLVWLYSVCRCWWVSIPNCEHDNCGVTSIGPRTASFLHFHHSCRNPYIFTFGISYHQFADDTKSYTVIKSKMNEDLVALYNCADAVTSWHIENDLFLSTAKTEALAVGTCQQVAKLNQSGGMMVFGSTIPFNNKLRVLEVILDNHLNLDDHITLAVQACNYHLHVLHHIRCWSPKTPLAPSLVQLLDPDWTTVIPIFMESLKSIWTYYNASRTLWPESSVPWHSGRPHLVFGKIFTGFLYMSESPTRSRWPRSRFDSTKSLYTSTNWSPLTHRHNRSDLLARNY